MDITISLRNTVNSPAQTFVLPTSLESIKAYFGLDETDDYIFRELGIPNDE